MTMRTIILTTALFLGGVLMAQTPTPCSNKASCCAGKKATAQATSTPLSCKLTSEEHQERKATVLASLRKQVLERKELDNGFAYRFAGSDGTVAELSRFIETERECCPFFVFDLDVAEDKSTAWLSLTGPEGVKEVIKTELAL